MFYFIADFFYYSCWVQIYCKSKCDYLQRPSKRSKIKTAKIDLEFSSSGNDDQKCHWNKVTRDKNPSLPFVKHKFNDSTLA